MYRYSTTSSNNHTTSSRNHWVQPQLELEDAAEPTAKCVSQVGVRQSFQGAHIVDLHVGEGLLVLLQAQRSQQL